jgi:putative aldouronate transport system permease protein
VNTFYRARRFIFKHTVGSDILFDVVNTTLVVILTILFVYPLIYVISCSFSEAQGIWSGKVVLFPYNFTIDGYKMAFEYPNLWSGYLNSLLYAIVGTSISVSLNMITAYPLSRKDFAPRNYIMFLYVFCMLFSGGLIPTYLVVRSLGFIDKIWALVIPGAVSTWSIIVIRTYYTTAIPNDLYEAAEIDGCSKTRYFFKIIVPLSTPIIAVMVLFTAVGFWNSYFSALLYLINREKYPLQLILREILVMIKLGLFATGISLDVGNIMERLQKAANLKYAVIILASFPVMVIYPFVQRYFIRGIMIGAIKA